MHTGGAKGLTGKKIGEGVKMFRVEGIKGRIPGRIKLEIKLPRGY